MHLMHNNYDKQSGFVALISVIIIALVLTTVTFSLSFSGFISRFNIFDAENKEVSIGLAEACVDTAMLKLEQTLTYIGNEVITIGAGKQCMIRTINPNVDPVTIETQAEYNKSFTNLRIKVKQPPGVTVSSWEELPHF